MSSFVEVFDLSTGNVIRDFATEEDAMTALRRALLEFGTESVADLALLRFDDGHPTLIAMEGELLSRITESSSSLDSDSPVLLLSDRKGPGKTRNESKRRRHA